jgi:hypothetical protein
MVWRKVDTTCAAKAVAGSFGDFRKYRAGPKKDGCDCCCCCEAVELVGNLDLDVAATGGTALDPGAYKSAALVVDVNGIDVFVVERLDGVAAANLVVDVAAAKRPGGAALVGDVVDGIAVVVAERPGGATERTDGAAERPGGAAERTDGATERPGGATERTDGAAEKSGGAVIVGGVGGIVVVGVERPGGGGGGCDRSRAAISKPGGASGGGDGPGGGGGGS